MTEERNLDLAYPGFNVLLMGPSGTGKTFAIRSLVATGLEVFCLFLEPGLETLVGSYADNNEPIPDNLHWHYIQPKTSGFGDLKKSAEDIGKFDLAGLAKMKDINRSKNNQMNAVYGILNDFECQRTKTKFGPVDSFTNGCVLVIDSLSALNRIIMDMILGNKVVREFQEWQIAQTATMNFLHKLTSGCICHFVLIAHVEREVDPVLGGVKLMPSLPGKAISASFGQPFSDVILAVREQTNFYWDTANSQADVKTRNLPIQSKIVPDFGQIYNKWLTRAKLASGM
jgi:AAA domain